MKVSVVLPNYNGSKYLPRAIDSFVRQDHAQKELIIVDGKSSDQSHEIIQAAVRDHSSVRWLNEADSGISDAVNRGNAIAEGDVLGFMGSDDALLPGALSQVATFAALVDFDGVYFNKYMYFVQERQFVKRRPPVDVITVENLLEHGTITDLQTIFYRRRILERYQYNPENKTCMDYEMLLVLAGAGAFLAHVDAEVVLEYMDGNISHGANPKQLAEAQAVTERFQGDYDGPMWSDSMTGRLPAVAEEYKRAYDDCEARFAEAAKDWERQSKDWERERAEARLAYDDCEARFSKALHEWETERAATARVLAEVREQVAAGHRHIEELHQALEQASTERDQAREALDAIRATRWYRWFAAR